MDLLLITIAGILLLISTYHKLRNTYQTTKKTHN